MAFIKLYKNKESGHQIARNTYYLLLFAQTKHNKARRKLYNRELDDGTVSTKVTGFCQNDNKNEEKPVSVSSSC